MPRGNAHQSKVHYQGKDEDFIIFVDDIKAVQDWKNDRSIPLAQVVSGFKIFVTHKYEIPIPGLAANPSSPLAHFTKQTLENEFGTHNEDECLIKILEGGTLQETETAERQGPKNDSMGTRAAH
ncbi:MAG: hypothetical protein Q9182_007260 [Xanthomendoza sp. 2 TL-2023]